jgi:Mlc titration factor MtfA (ptsG expression regulator)
MGLAGWWQRLRTQREAQALARRAIPDDLWKRTLVRYPFLRRRNPVDEAELRRLTSLFLDRKEFHAVGGLRLTDRMAVTIAAQACLPVLRLGLARYDGFVGIVVHPAPVRAPREQADEAGVVHAWEEELAGEAQEGGPVMLSWHDVAQAGASAAAGVNVVIHEFAHVLDMEGGGADGVPRLPEDIAPADWQRVMAAEYEAFTERVQAADEGRAPPETLHDAALDPYGAQAPEEFFAVASEAFFVNAQPLLAQHPALYALLARFYQQDPALDQPPVRGRQT